MRGSGVGLPVKEGFTRSRFNRGVEQNPLQAALARYKYKYQVVNSMGGGQTPLAALFRAPGRVRKEEERKLRGKCKGE